ncbi:hypothetical protein [Nocardia sp. NPDC003979]
MAPTLRGWAGAWVSMSMALRPANPVVGMKISGSTCKVQRSSMSAKGEVLDPVIAAITQGRPFRHVVRFEAGEMSRCDRMVARSVWTVDVRSRDETAAWPDCTPSRVDISGSGGEPILVDTRLEPGADGIARAIVSGRDGTGPYGIANVGLCNRK